MRKSPILYFSTFLFLLILSPIRSFAQDEWRVWNTLSLGLPLTKNLDGRIAYLRSTDLTNGSFENNFNWYQFRLSYRFNRTWSTRAGTIWMSTPSGNVTNRVFANVFHSSRLNRRLTLKNGIQLETHNREESRYDQRIILMSRLGFRKRLKFLKVAPSFSYSLFYNIGGDPITYYSSSGEVITQKPSNGFHRGRALVNFNFILSDPIRLSVYYMNQQEFNLAVSETNKINVLNMDSNRIQRPFNNYHVVGLSLSYQLKGKNKDSLLPINF
ncbi:DUF2490 domain-containing protein [Algoriphagus sp. CAU 1675]|uniref:DUF2490 domain-containing protein n=1 Tax=Algoriphagus sp. CAU 1675 TaxID=3032597 RepID=UPI0023DC0539|nr:DUF2490 domain-containing protein [Algoriphagus sp. CAU 1675]MDF2159279.1 DUF2490 domain-containing protein [Algoriphagus sp. CAU 1675]